MGEPVEQRAGEPLAAQHAGPFVEETIAGDDGAATLIALAEDLEQNLRASGRQRHIVQFVDDQKLVGCQLALDSQQALQRGARAILCWNLFDRLPRGAAVVNVVRGGHLASEDLCAALNDGRRSAAFLEVTDPESLPEGYPFYSHPKILLTPHISGVTRGETAVHALIATLRRILAGQQPEGGVDRARGS